MFPVLDEKGEPVSIERAVRGVTYRCPECKDKLMVRAGTIRKKHFAHHTNSACPYTAGGGEGTVHLAAKLSLVEYLSRGEAFHFTRQCIWCKQEQSHQIQRKEGETVKAEYRLTYEGRTIIPDIAVLRPSCSTFERVDSDVTTPFHRKGEMSVNQIIEVRHTHTQENRPEPWCEFDANAILSALGKEKQTPLRDLRSVSCTGCRPHSDVAISCKSCRSPTAPSLLNSASVCLRCRIAANRRTPYARRH